MFSKEDVGALNPDGSLAIDHDKAHLGHATHVPHGLSRLWQEIIGAGHAQILVKEDRQGRSGHFAQAHRVAGGIAIDDINVCLGTDLVNRFLQLTELLNTQLSVDTHVKDQDERCAARNDCMRLPLSISELKLGGWRPHKRVDVLRNP